MRVTTKDQVTIAQEVRRRLGIEPSSGSTSRWTTTSFGSFGPLGSRAALVVSMPGRGRVSMSTDEIMALTLGDV